MVPPSTIDEWRASDPVCQRFAWYNVLMYFAIARADALSLSDRIRGSEDRLCPVCRHTFRETHYPWAFIRRLGPYQIDICSVCMQSIVFAGWRRRSHA